MSRQDEESANQKPTPARSMAGKARNIGSDGNTNQNVACAREAIRSVSPVSFHSHNMLRMEIRGSETMSAPNAGLLRAISETIATITPEITALTSRYNMLVCLAQSRRRMNAKGPKGKRRPAEVIGAVKTMRIATGEEAENYDPAISARFSEAARQRLPFSKISSTRAIRRSRSSVPQLVLPRPHCPLG